MESSFFTSKREKRLWIFAAICLLIIYLGIPFSGTYLELQQQFDITSIYVMCFVLVLFSVAGFSFRYNFNLRSVLITFGIITVLIQLFVRSGMTAAERTHLFEYGLLGPLIYHALLERKKGGKFKWSAYWFALAATFDLGILDECIQYFAPNRVFDAVDILFNVIASFLTISVSAIIVWLQQRFIDYNMKKSP